MNERQLLTLVALQDLDNMIHEIKKEEGLGFKTEGIDNFAKIRQDLAGEIDPALLRNYERLHQKHRRAIVPVRDDICLGCFVTLPTSLMTRGKENISIFRCENCGRILYWLD